MLLNPVIELVDKPKLNAPSNCWLSEVPYMFTSYSVSDGID